jgi:hypothetical protein
MSVLVVRCPACRTKLRTRDNAAGRKIKCPQCGAILLVPDAATTASERPVPPDPPPHLRPIPDPVDEAGRKYEGESDALGDRYSPTETVPPATTDVPGIVALIFGIVAIICLFLGCIIPLVPYIIATCLAMAGLLLSFFGKGGFKVAGLTLNGLTLAPSVLLLFCCGFGFAGLVGLGAWVPTQKGDGRAKAQLPVPGPNALPQFPRRPAPPPRRPLANRDERGTLVLRLGRPWGPNSNSPWRGGQALEVFIDGRLQEDPIITPWQSEIELRITPGTHAVTVKKDGIEIYSKQVTVKNPAEGKTFEDVDLREASPGTLVLDLVGPDAVRLRGRLLPSGNALELFIDGRLQEARFPGLEHGPIELPLMPGEHAVTLKWNGVEVYSKPDLTVSKRTEGKTFHHINLVITAKVVIKNRTIRKPLYEVYVYVDGKKHKSWPVGEKEIEVEVEVGTREISVRSRPVRSFVEMIEVAHFTRQIKPGKPIICEMNN